MLTFGSCGFTDATADGKVYLPFARDAVAASADTNPDYPGSCGRCYAMRCKEGLVQNNDGGPLKQNTVFYLPKVSEARSLKDTYGRTWPGNPAEAEGNMFTKCWNSSQEVTVRMIDTCPCTQVLPDGAPGVKKGGEVRKQLACCGGKGGFAHFDLSFWAFEKLAHPLSGRMMLEYRPVDCETGQPLPTFTPGFISKDVIYSNGTKAGWNWFPYFSAYKRYAVPGRTLKKTAATCVELTENGGLSFHVKEGNQPGYQPFAGVTAIQLTLRSNSNDKSPDKTATPKNEPVDLKVFLQNYESKKYCNSDARTGQFVTQSLGDGWFSYKIPLSAFKCDYEGALPHQLTRIDLQNTKVLHAAFCLGELRLLRG
uniref:Expansin-like EG45 domain-containing protein n=1 Tax=Tetradesmus obliquus TaxID=3088 RepID=A0A383WGT9_TETOB|eukprot:jgi/Sobl393_1/17014/SZX76432.1